MVVQNSLLEFNLGLLQALHSDVASSAKVPRVERDRDWNYIQSRTCSEGLSFLTKTLPRLGKAFDKALATGEQLQCPSFKLKKGTHLPRFLGWMVSRVFDSDGRERSDACPAVLGYLRQLCYLYYKLELPYTEGMVAKAISQFVDVDKGCSLETEHLDSTSLRILHGARSLLRYITHDLDLRDIVPRHGPGVVSTGETGQEKTWFTRIIAKLEKFYPFTDYFFFNYTHLSDRLDTIPDKAMVPSGVAKLILVPKDSRGPRLISAEPLENQWIQQGQMKNIVHHLETHPLTRGRVNFRDQKVNGSLALAGSRTGEWCTLDMKEASDRVSVDLVKTLFHEHLYQYLDASRSTHTKLPDGSLVELKKFAPMGSALCFPVEALVFWTLAVSSIICKHNLSLSKAASLVYVYGDDIICRSDHHATIRQYLPKFGLLLNEDKCCTAGFFRESCGVDAFHGIDVTPTKISRVWSHRWTPDVLSSYCQYSNEFWRKGFVLASKFIEDRLQSLCSYEALTYRSNMKVKGRKAFPPHLVPSGSIPYSQTSQFGGLCFVRPGLHTYSRNKLNGVRTRFNHRFSQHEVYAPVVVGANISAKETDWEELLYRFSDNVPLEMMHVSQRHEEVYTLAEQLSELNSRRYDDKVREDTIWCLTHPAPDSRVMSYPVRHRNRIQWRWVGTRD